MENHEAWRINYRKNRYMEFLSTDNLEQRLNDIFSNLMILSPEGKISLREVNGNGLYWMILWTDILEEFVIRYGPYPNGFENDFIKKLEIVKPDLKIEAKKAIDKIGGIKNDCIYKYSKVKYNLETLKNGKLRIAPATYYKDSSLNYAIKDDELVFDILHHPKDILITNTRNNKKIEPISNVKTTYELNTNYYVQCFSTEYTYREYDDFEADSCLIIYDIERFILKVKEQLLAKYKNFDFFVGKVDYIDPLKYKNEPNVFFSKHFKYSYQNEYRIVFVPKKSILDLKEFFIEIGSIEEYAKVIEIKKD